MCERCFLCGLVVRIVQCTLDIVLRCDEPHLLLSHCKVESCESQSTAECCQCLHHKSFHWSFGIRRDRRDSQVNVVDRSKDWYCCVTFVSFAKEVDHLQTVSGGSEKRDVRRRASSANAVGTHSSTRYVCRAMSSSVLTRPQQSCHRDPLLQPNRVGSTTCFWILWQAWKVLPEKLLGEKSLMITTGVALTGAMVGGVRTEVERASNRKMFPNCKQK